jgi:hypothetical protein
MTGGDGKAVLVVAMEREITEAAQAVIKLMYEGAVPRSVSAIQLAKVGDACFGGFSCASNPA